MGKQLPKWQSVGLDSGLDVFSYSADSSRCPQSSSSSMSWGSQLLKVLIQPSLAQPTLCPPDRCSWKSDYGQHPSSDGSGRAIKTEGDAGGPGENAHICWDAGTTSPRGHLFLAENGEPLVMRVSTSLNRPHGPHPPALLLVVVNGSPSASTKNQLSVPYRELTSLQEPRYLHSKGLSQAFVVPVGGLA